MSRANEREARRLSFDAIGETCPKVDRLRDKAIESVGDALSVLIDSIKEEATIPLREALDNAYLELIQAQQTIEELEERIAEKNQHIESLEAELEEVAKALDAKEAA
ncbi:hypothetical protein I5U77_03045 [Stenotrophomonas maltophilia]|uniref:hypothetical protein n=1 Tax=Stenotrophomonas maltophilia TaxID=40324 RepID=UPI0013DBA04E|nr:hypothetical protein [Stenotrophomonas maltophilia]MBH1591428.1 hypothetical protein [Stenotrophomonas maltophilia]